MEDKNLIRPATDIEVTVESLVPPTSAAATLLYLVSLLALAGLCLVIIVECIL